MMIYPRQRRDFGIHHTNGELFFIILYNRLSLDYPIIPIKFLLQSNKNKNVKRIVKYIAGIEKNLETACVFCIIINSKQFDMQFFNPTRFKLMEIMKMRRINVGLLGMGNIGTGTYKTLEMNKGLITERTDADIAITKILEIDVYRQRDVKVGLDQFTQNPDDILLDPDIDIVIELLGGIEPATGFMIQAMENGKHVVTANKAALAADYDRFMAVAKENNVLFRFEASVGGGIPILTALSGALQANEYMEISGILNGTTNYILTQMTENEMPYDSALKLAQEKGFAEADPTADVDGHDAANKLSVLISLLFGKRVHPDDIPTIGIRDIGVQDIKKAEDEKAKIKLIAQVKHSGDTLEYSVKPMFIPISHPLAGVNYEFNAIFVKGNAVDELMFYGRGAGPLPTGSAVMGDVIEISKAIVKEAQRR